MTFSSLNIADTVHFSCAGGDAPFNYRSQWIAQMLLPMVYPVYCVVSIGAELLIDALARRQLPPAQLLLRRGWRPRRDFSLNALVDAYLPAGVFFLNMYYNTAISKAFSMLICIEDGANGRSFVQEDPELTCWEDEHTWLALGALVGVAIYLIGVPALFCYVLFWKIPASGLEKRRTLAIFGFLYTRFEPTLWYWELVEMLRKVMFVTVMQWGHKLDPATQSILALGGVSSIMILNIMNRPFHNNSYNLLENITTVTEFVCILLGMALISDPSREQQFEWVVIVVWSFLAASFSAIILTAALDVLMLRRQRRARLVSNKTNCVVSWNLFNLHCAQPCDASKSKPHPPSPRCMSRDQHSM